MSTATPFRGGPELFRDVRDTFGAIRLVKAGSNRHWHTILKIDRERFLGAKSARQVIVLIENELSKLSQSTLADGDWILSIPATDADGFAIDISRSGGRIRGLFGELEEEFESLAAAMPWVERALSDSYRLRITVIGGRQCAWHLEPSEKMSPLPGQSLAMGHGMLLDSFRRKTSIIRRNGFAGVQNEAPPSSG